MIDWTQLTEFTKKVAENSMAYATAMAAIGVLTMAIIQTLKDMFPTRDWFQEWRLKAWLREKAAVAANIGAVTPNADTAEQDLIRLATAGDRGAFYDLSIEQMCGQMNAAAQIILEYPGDHKDLLGCLASLAKKEDIEELLEVRSGTMPGMRTQPQVDARTRVIHHVQRSIDGFQISTGFRWKWLLQVVSFAVSFVLIFAGLSLYERSGSSSQIALNTPWFVLIGLIGGFLAPVARDLVVALQKLRS